MKKRLSIINGRFQVGSLHPGHIQFINDVVSKSDKTIILLGTPSAKGTNTDPLDYETRKLMFAKVFPSLEVYKAMNFKSDEKWSQNIDKIVLENHSLEEYDIYFCGSRDSCITYYSGQFTTEIIESVDSSHSGTNERKLIGENPIQSEDFRKGVIYSTQNRYPISYQAVDIAVLDDHGNVCLGRKPNETQFRFVGGFVDTTDLSLEAAAKREAMEELGNCEFGDFKYIGSMRVNDWRYRACSDKIMTSFFTCKYVYGIIKASDDLAEELGGEVKWIPLTELENEDIVGEHKQLVKMLLDNIK